MTIRDQLIKLIDDHCARHKISRRAFGAKAANNSNLYWRIASPGIKGINLQTMETVLDECGAEVTLKVRRKRRGPGAA